MKKKSNRSLAFRALKCILKIFKRKPKVVFLGEPFTDKAIYLCNHVGASGPLTLELYFPKLFRFWGVYLMNGTMKERYNYLSTIYFRDKRHLNKHLAKIIGFIATPFMTIFYKGIKLISTYNDARFVTTVKKSINVLNENQSIIIFPEDSSKGYFDLLKKFLPGFYALAEVCYKKGMDLPIYLMYLQRLNSTLYVDKPIKFSELKALNMSKEGIANMFKERANELALMSANIKKEIYIK